MIKEVIDWGTNNHAYHTLVHCMAHDYPWIGADVLVNSLIILVYGAVAVCFCICYSEFKKKRGLKPLDFRNLTILEEGIIWMAAVFISCLISGYFGQIIRIWIPIYRIITLNKAITVCIALRFLYLESKSKVLKKLFDNLLLSEKQEKEIKRLRDKLNE